MPWVVVLVALVILVPPWVQAEYVWLVGLLIGVPLVLLYKRPLIGLIVVLVLVPLLLPERWGDQGVIAGLLIVLIALALLTVRRTWKVSLPLALVVLLEQLAVVTVFLRGGNALVREGPVILLITACTWLVANSVGVARRQAEAARAGETEQAIEAERLRIAREMHDLIAHSLGVIAIQAGVGSRVIETQPSEAGNALRAIESTSRQTLAEVRRTLTALRRSDPEGAPVAPAPGLADLGQLVARARDAGVSVEVERLGAVRLLPADLELSAFRIVQESVTNVVRHAGTPRCLVRLEFGADELAIEVLDDGRGTLEATGSGYGLVGMRERTSLLGGRFSAGQRSEGGFRVSARLPVPMDA